MAARPTSSNAIALISDSSACRARTATQPSRPRGVIVMTWRPCHGLREHRPASGADVPPLGPYLRPNGNLLIQGISRRPLPVAELLAAARYKDRNARRM